jgi:hypothetical protein
MESVEGQRICGKLCFEVEKTTAETHNKFCEAYGDDA